MSEADVLAAIKGIAVQIDALPKKIVALLGPPASGGGNATDQPPVTTPPPPNRTAEIRAFISKYAASDDTSFQQKYGRQRGASLPPLPVPLTQDAVIAYAKEGYTYQGQYRGGPVPTVMGEGSPEQVANQAIAEIAAGANGYYAGTPAVEYDSDVVAIAAKSGLICSQGQSQQFGSSSNSPVIYHKVPMDIFLQRLVAGSQAIPPPKPA